MENMLKSREKPVPDPVNFHLKHTHSNFNRIIGAISHEHIIEVQEVMTPRSLRNYLSQTFENMEDMLPTLGDDVDEEYNTANHEMRLDEMREMMRKLKQPLESEETPRTQLQKEFVQNLAVLFQKLLADGIVMGVQQERDKSKKLATSAFKSTSNMSALSSQGNISAELTEHLELLMKQVASRDEFIEKLERKISGLSTKLDMARHLYESMKYTFDGLTRQGLDELRARLAYYEGEREYLYARLLGEGKDMDGMNRGDIEKIISNMRQQHEEHDRAEIQRRTNAQVKREVEAALERYKHKIRDQMFKSTRQKQALRRKIEALEEQLMLGFDPQRPEKSRGVGVDLLDPKVFDARREDILTYVFGGPVDQSEWHIEAVTRGSAEALEIFGRCFGPMGYVLDNLGRGRKKEAYSTLADLQGQFISARQTFYDVLRNTIQQLREKPLRNARAVQCPDSEIRKIWFKERSVMTTQTKKHSGSVASVVNSDNGNPLPLRQRKMSTNSLKSAMSGGGGSRRESFAGSETSTSESASTGLNRNGSFTKTNSFTNGSSDPMIVVSSGWKSVFIALSRLLGTLRGTLRISHDEVSIYETHDYDESDLQLVSSMKQSISNLNAHRVVLENIRLPFDLIQGGKGPAAPAAQPKSGVVVGGDVPKADAAPTNTSATTTPASTPSSTLGSITIAPTPSSRTEKSAREIELAEEREKIVQTKKIQLRSVEARLIATKEQKTRYEKQMKDATHRKDLETVGKISSVLNSVNQKITKYEADATKIKSDLENIDAVRVEMSTVLENVGVKHDTLLRVAAMREEVTKGKLEVLKAKQEAVAGDPVASEKIKKEIEAIQNTLTEQSVASTTLKEELSKVEDVAKLEEEEREQIKQSIQTSVKVDPAPTSTVMIPSRKVSLPEGEDDDSSSSTTPKKPDFEPTDTIDDARRIKDDLLKSSVTLDIIYCKQCVTKMSCRFCGQGVGIVPLSLLQGLLGAITDMQTKTRTITRTNLQLVKENVSLRLLREKYDNDPSSQAVRSMLARGERMRQKWEERKKMLANERAAAYQRAVAVFGNTAMPTIPQPAPIPVRTVFEAPPVDTSKALSYRDFLKVQTGQLQTVNTVVPKSILSKPQRAPTQPLPAMPSYHPAVQPDVLLEGGRTAVVRHNSVGSIRPIVGGNNSQGSPRNQQASVSRLHTGINSRTERSLQKILADVSVIQSRTMDVVQKQVVGNQQQQNPPINVGGSLHSPLFSVLMPHAVLQQHANQQPSVVNTTTTTISTANHSNLNSMSVPMFKGLAGFGGVSALPSESESSNPSVFLSKSSPRSPRSPRFKGSFKFLEKLKR